MIIGLIGHAKLDHSLVIKIIFFQLERAGFFVLLFPHKVVVLKCNMRFKNMEEKEQSKKDKNDRPPYRWDEDLKEVAEKVKKIIEEEEQNDRDAGK